MVKWAQDLSGDLIGGVTAGDKPGKTRAPAESWVGPRLRGQRSQYITEPDCVSLMEESCFCGRVKVRGNLKHHPEGAGSGPGQRLEKTNRRLLLKLPTSQNLT